MAAVATESARIGDGADLETRGVISRANRLATACGVVPGGFALPGGGRARRAHDGAAGPPRHAAHGERTAGHEPRHHHAEAREEQPAQSSPERVARPRGDVALGAQVSHLQRWKHQKIWDEQRHAEVHEARSHGTDGPKAPTHVCRCHGQQHQEPQASQHAQQGGPAGHTRGAKTASEQRRDGHHVGRGQRTQRQVERQIASGQRTLPEPEGH